MNFTVFGAENITDNKIDEGMKYVYNIMISNKNFNEIFSEIIQTLKNVFLKMKNQ